MTLFSELPTKESKRGRGTDKTPVVFGLSLDTKGRPDYLRAKVCTGIDGDILTDFDKNCIAPGSLIRSDGLPSYKRLSKEGFLHEAEVFDSKENPEHLKWLHTLIQCKIVYCWYLSWLR